MINKNFLTVISEKVFSFRGTLEIPGDKSISHRSLILSSIAIGKTKISGLLESDDVLATLKSLRHLGVKISKDSENNYLVYGVGSFGFRSPTNALNLGNSGTGARLLMGVVSGQNISAKFIGDESLSSRPMNRITCPLKKLGAKIDFDNESISKKTLPLTIIGTDTPLPIQIDNKIASAQIKSAIMLACINARGKIIITEPQISRDHTEIMFRHFGINVKKKSLSNGRHQISFYGEANLISKNITIPKDPSSASFAIVATLITPKSHLIIPNICLNPQRIGLITTLIEMGAKIKIHNPRIEGNEELGDLEIISSKLRGVNVPSERSASMIDEYPILCIAASIASGKTIMNGIEELRVKESDRINVMANGLKLAGIKVKETRSSLEIEGIKIINGGITINSENDHRIAMSFLILGMITQNPIKVLKCETIFSSFPNFFEIMTSAGAKFIVKNKK